MKPWGLIGVLAALGAISTAIAQPEGEVAACRALPPVEDIAFDAAPPALRDALKRDLGRFVGPGEPFDAYDEVRTGVNKRVLWIRRLGDRWVVAVWIGGRFIQTPALAYRLGAADRIAVLRGRAGGFPNTVCQLTERELYRGP